MDDIVRTVKGDSGAILEANKKLHPSLQLTIAELHSNSNLAFLDINFNVDSGRKVTCGWYQKPTDTGTILNFRGCAPLQYDRSVFEWAVQRVFGRTSTKGKIRPDIGKKLETMGLKSLSKKMVRQVGD